MNHITIEGWIIVGMSILFILIIIGFTIHVVNKYRPEFVLPPSPTEESDVLTTVTDDDVMDDD